MNILEREVIRLLMGYGFPEHIAASSAEVYFSNIDNVQNYIKENPTADEIAEFISQNVAPWD